MNKFKIANCAFVVQRASLLPPWQTPKTPATLVTAMRLDIGVTLKTFQNIVGL